MKKKYILGVMIIVAIVLFLAHGAHSISNPNEIVWNGAPRTFITSLYLGVLGRMPENQAVVTEWAGQIKNDASSRYRVFWGFVNSREYQQSRWATQPREYYVYRRYNIQGDFYSYSVSKGPLGADYYPQEGPYLYSLARALRDYYQTFARRLPQNVR